MLLTYQAAVRAIDHGTVVWDADGNSYRVTGVRRMSRHWWLQVTRTDNGEVGSYIAAVHESVTGIQPYPPVAPVQTKADVGRAGGEWIPPTFANVAALAADFGGFMHGDYSRHGGEYRVVDIEFTDPSLALTFANVAQRDWVAGSDLPWRNWTVELCDPITQLRQAVVLTVYIG